jgi:hypothetical protein
MCKKRPSKALIKNTKATGGGRKLRRFITARKKLRNCRRTPAKTTVTSCLLRELSSEKLSSDNSKARLQNGFRRIASAALKAAERNLLAQNWKQGSIT